MALGKPLYLSEPVSTFKDGGTNPSLWRGRHTTGGWLRRDSCYGEPTGNSPPPLLRSCLQLISLRCSGFLSPQHKECSWHTTYVACRGILPRTPRGTTADLSLLKQSANPNWKTRHRNVLTFHVVIITTPRHHQSQKNLVFLKVEKKERERKPNFTVCGGNRYKRTLWSRLPWAGVSAPRRPRWATPGK